MDATLSQAQPASQPEAGSDSDIYVPESKPTRKLLDANDSGSDLPVDPADSGLDAPGDVVDSDDGSADDDLPLAAEGTGDVSELEPECNEW